MSKKTEIKIQNGKVSQRGNKPNKRANNFQGKGRINKVAQRAVDSYENAHGEGSFERDKQAPGHNDISQLFRNPSVSKNACKVLDCLNVGTDLSLVDENYIDKTFIKYLSALDKYTVPGLKSLYYVPLFGMLRKGSPANEAIVSMYNDICQVLTTDNLKCDPVDLGLYDMATVGICIMYAIINKIARGLSSYKYDTEYTPRNILASMGVDYDDMLRHKADLVTLMDEFVRMANSYVFVKTSNTYAARAIEIASGLWKDNDTDRYQMIHCVPRAIPKLCHNDETGEWYIDYIGLCTIAGIRNVGSGGYLTYETLKSKMYELFDAFSNDTDIRNIQAMYIKAYGSQAKMTFDNTLDKPGVLEPVFNSEMMSQFENYTYHCWFGTGSWTTGSRFRIKQDDTKAYLIQDMHLKEVVNTVDAMMPGLKNVVNLHESEVTDEKMYVATRMQYVSEVVDGMHTVTACNSELIICTVFDNAPLHDNYYPLESEGGETPHNYYCRSLMNGHIVNGDTDIATLDEQVKNLRAWSVFNRAKLIPCWTVIEPEDEEDLPTVTSFCYVGPVDKLVVIERDNLKAMFRANAWSMWGISI